MVCNSSAKVGSKTASLVTQFCKNVAPKTLKHVTNTTKIGVIAKYYTIFLPFVWSVSILCIHLQCNIKL